MLSECDASLIAKKIEKKVKKISQDRERRKTYTITVKPSILNRLKAIAEEENIYLSDLIEHIFSVYLRYRERERENDCE